MARTTVAVASGGGRKADRHAHRHVLSHAQGLALGLVAGLLASCATYAPAPIDPAKTARAFEAARLDDSDIEALVARVTPEAARAWPPAEWDRASLFAVALAANGSLAIARAEVDAALAAEITAGEAPNPTLGLQSEYARREADHWLYGISFDFLLRRRADLDARLASLATAGAREQLMEKTWSVRRALIAALSDRESARHRLDVLARLADAEDRVVALQHRRVAAGEDAPSDLATAEAARIEIEQQEADARADAVAADAALAAALGMPAASLDGIAIAWPDWGEPPELAASRLDAAREEALLSRADLAAAIDDYAAAETRLERAVARQYPQFEFRPGYYWDHGIAKWPFDVDLALPLFNRNKGEIAEATAARALAGERMLALQREIDGAIDAAIRSEAVAQANVDAAMRRDAALRGQLARADTALRLGASDRLERSNAETLALRAELETVAARARRQAARNALEDALHAPQSGPELALARSPSAESGANR